jgi:hypothetical protein
MNFNYETIYKFILVIRKKRKTTTQYDKVFSDPDAKYELPYIYVSESGAARYIVYRYMKKLREIMNTTDRWNNPERYRTMTSQVIDDFDFEVLHD